ncbi:MAG TPA: hypothetical protein P5246_02360 [Candidatus Omnitrophota bacterium]|nr:hypothetical protein [Candidatus Omnitrophota bacterium]HSA31264.1 hypothetical protein [Candidatus Omnitrophota bacterium]
MKIRALIITAFLCGGCSVNYNAVTVPEAAPMARRFISLNDVRNGLKRSEVNSLLGRQVVVGYEMADLQAQQYSPITQANPYKTETYRQGEKSYAVDFYLLGIETGDGEVSDNELVPMVFYNDVLIGHGWDYFNRKIKPLKK